MARPWVLGIDFGTSYTVVAGRSEGEPPEIVDVAGSRRMPSVVFVDDGGQIVVGEFAERMLATRPEAALRTPKARLGDASPVVLAGRPRQPTELVAAVLRTCVGAALDHFGSPPSRARLTYPATWSRSRIAKLDEAARLAGIDDPFFVPEPVAAAVAYWQRGELAEGAYVGVYDLGGGTFDSAVLRATGGRFEIVGRPGGDATVGGEMFDELVMQELGSRLPPNDWEAIQLDGDPAWSHARAALHTEARLAKETLSSRPWVEVALALPGGVRTVRLERDELDAMLEPYVRDTVDALTRCVHDAGLDPRNLAALQLVGGASRAPIVERMVGAAFPGIPLQRRGDPKASVALGATLVDDAATVPLALAGGSTPTPTPPHTPVLTPSHTLPPVPPPPRHGAPPASPPPPPQPNVGEPPPTIPIAVTAGTPRSPAYVPPAPPPNPPRRRTGALIAGVVGLIAVAAIAVGVIATSGGDDDGGSSSATTGAPQVVDDTDTDSANSSETATITTADTARSTAATTAATTAAPLTTAATTAQPTVATTTGGTPAPGPAPAPTPAPGASGVTLPVTNRIAFVSNRDGDDEIYLMRPDGSDVVQLTNNDDKDWGPSFSPDGMMIAFAHRPAGSDNADIYVMRADGSNWERLTDYPGDDMTPSWSPDGARIAFSSKRDGLTDIYVMDASGGNLDQLTTATGAEEITSWSPDSSRIAFDRQVGTGPLTIFVIYADGSGEQQITDGVTDAYGPAWSPDGTRLAFAYEEGGDGEIVVATVGSSAGPIALTTNSRQDYWPKWSPDGTYLSFTTGSDNNEREIMVMRADGSDVRQLTSNGARDQLAVWSP